MRSVEGNYEYDPKTRQYRRKRIGEEEATEKDRVVPEPLPGVPAEENPNYAIREEEDINFAPPRPPGLTPGKIVFWMIFSIIFCGWMYFMYNMYQQDQQQGPKDMETLLEEEEEYKELESLGVKPKIKPEDIDPDIDKLNFDPSKISAPPVKDISAPSPPKIVPPVDLKN